MWGYRDSGAWVKGGVMGFGGGPKAPPPPPPPPQVRDPEAQAAAARARAASRNRRGRASTILRGEQEQLGAPKGAETLG